MGKFVELPIGSKLFKNLDPAALTSTFTALENALVNEAGGLTRLPGMVEFSDLGHKEPVYLSTLHNDMIACSGDGNVIRLDKNANKDTIPGPQVLGGKRVIFTADSSNLYMTAGSRIIGYDGSQLAVISKDAPLASHIGFSNNYLLANEVDTQFFFNSNAGDTSAWDGLDVFIADAKPDNVTAILITDFNEIIVAGPDSIEQYDRLIGGTAPFVRRWSVGDGISEPYTLIFADNAAWALNQFHEFSRYSGQTGQIVSGDIAKDILTKYTAESLDNFMDAWAASLRIKGQTFILLQFPKASNDYGGNGITYLLDIRQSKFCQLYGWDTKMGIPALWPGVSILSLWGKTFIGGYGKIYRITDDAYNIDGDPMRFYVKSAHYNELGLIRIDSIRVTIKRGVGTYETAPKLAMRINRDDQGFGKWQYIDLGKSGNNHFVAYFGDQGEADTWQFEFAVTDDCPIEIRKIEAETTPLVR